MNLESNSAAINRICPETERNAYNAAFYELGLRWHWDGETYQSLQAIDNPGERIRRYLESEHPHLLRAYDANFLTDAIESRKARFANRGADSRGMHFNWAAARAGELGA